MPLIPFPDVPDASGVPSVPRSGSPAITMAVPLGNTSRALARSLQQTPVWGIYAASTSSTSGAQLGANALLSTGSVDFIKEMMVSDFPTEKGGFASYNKVEKPATPTVVLILGGTSADRSALISIIDAAVKSTNLYDVVTPDYTLTNCTLGKWSLRRAPERGANLVAISISLIEIRQVSATYVQSGVINSPQSSSAAPQVSSGTVQSTWPSSAVSSAVTNNLTLLDTPYNILATMGGK